MQDYGCFFGEYGNKLIPIFYTKLSLLTDLFDYQEIEKHKIFEVMETEEKNNNENLYILKIEDMGLPFIPVQKDIVQDMISEGTLLENIDILTFVEKYKNTHPYITEEYMTNLVPLLKYEIKKMEINLMHYKLSQEKNKNINIEQNYSDSSDDNLK
jgi:hypothetical protein